MLRGSKTCLVSPYCRFLVETRDLFCYLPVGQRGAALGQMYRSLSESERAELKTRAAQKTEQVKSRQKISPRITNLCQHSKVGTKTGRNEYHEFLKQHKHSWGCNSRSDDFAAKARAAAAAWQQHKKLQMDNRGAREETVDHPVECGAVAPPNAKVDVALGEVEDDGSNAAALVQVNLSMQRRPVVPYAQRAPNAYHEFLRREANVAAVQGRR